MNYREDYVFWRLAYFFISEQGYRIIQLFDNQKELWLEKLESKGAPIVRLLRQDINWSNSIQKDIEFCSANGERVRRQVRRGELNLLNIYVSQFPPVDEYEYRLAKPFVYPEGKKTSVNSVLLSSKNYDEGLQCLSERYGKDISFPINEEYSEYDATHLKNTALEYAIKKVNSERAVFKSGKPFFTYVFMIIQIAVFFWLETHGGSTNNQNLIKYGAKFNPYIQDGEWWRLLTPVFLHSGFTHLAMNTLSLYFIGTAVERMYGSVRFLFIYLFSGITGFIASFLFVDNVSVGASGAIAGCFGALLYFGVIYPKLFARTLGTYVIAIFLVNIAFGFSQSGIDNAGHLGGLIGGFLASGMTHFPKRKKPLLQVLFLLLSIVAVAISLSFGFSDTSKTKDVNSNLILAQEYMNNENYKQAYEVLMSVEEKSENPSAQIYFLLSFTEIKQNMLKEARTHLLKSLSLEPDVPEANYNLALIYLEENDLIQGKKYAERAAKLSPDKKEYSALVREIDHLIQSSGGGE
ncbi:rhomboid family intramembrane serine protease [Neobacillus rhizosphaerae]|uniref:rhomboid family intramembrane serine protease n=1 Tax=Neobacillus rhizosphaerae TaxID=2880965 RepID=UPI003D2B49D6